MTRIFRYSSTFIITFKVKISASNDQLTNFEYFPITLFCIRTDSKSLYGIYRYRVLFKKNVRIKINFDKTQIGPINALALLDVPADHLTEKYLNKKKEQIKLMSMEDNNKKREGKEKLL